MKETVVMACDQEGNIQSNVPLASGYTVDYEKLLWGLGYAVEEPIKNDRHCLNCGCKMLERECKVRCIQCGYFEDCSNLL